MAGGWLARLGLRTREQRAWATYDWANSAFQCTIITAVFPIYFTSVASKGVPQATATEHFATATTIALTIIAVLSPILGAYADYAGAKKRLLLFPFDYLNPVGALRNDVHGFAEPFHALDHGERAHLVKVIGARILGVRRIGAHSNAGKQLFFGGEGCLDGSD